MWLTILWNNRRLIAEIVVVAAIGIAVWYFGVHLPRVIAQLKAEKAELVSQVAGAEAAFKMLEKLQKEKGAIDAATFAQISSVKASTLPRRGVLIPGGLPLPALH